MKYNKFFSICAILCLMLIATNGYTAGNPVMDVDSNYTATSKDLQEIEQEARICFSDEAAKKLVVELEQCRIVNKNIVNYYKSNVELTKQVQLLKTEVELLNQKFEIADKLLKTNEELYKQKEKVLNDELEEAKKPRWSAMFISGGIGAGLALLLALAI